jgi:hypothetical protein
MNEMDESAVEPESSAAGEAHEALGEATKEGESDTEAKNNFQFLTFTDFQQTTDPRTKKKVRSHVMQRVHRTMRSGGRAHQEGVIVLDTSSLLGAPQQYQDASLLPSPNAMGSGRSNPFANYPIPMNGRTRHLFDHCKPLLSTISVKLNSC